MKSCSISRSLRPLEVPVLETQPAQVVRKAFVDELTRTLVAALTIENYAPVGQLLREWKVKAELHADPRMARRLNRAITADGDVLPAPAG